jgi:hypothetical protein
MKQPYHLAGNIFNIEDSSDIALGYFTVASVNKERYFFKRPDVKFYFEKCYYRNSLPPYTGHDFFVFKDHEGKWSYAGQKCMDCRMHGGEIEKPEFWINHLNIKTKI